MFCPNIQTKTLQCVNLLLKLNFFVCTACAVMKLKLSLTHYKQLHITSPVYLCLFSVAGLMICPLCMLRRRIIHFVGLMWTELNKQKNIWCFTTCPS